MGNTGDIARVNLVIIGTLVAWGLIHLNSLVPDYYPPDNLINNLDRGWFDTAGLRKLAMARYATVALIVIAILFGVVQQRWLGRDSFKGFVFGSSFGVVLFFGFLGSS